MVQVNLDKRIRSTHKALTIIKDVGMAKLNKIALGLITELESIRDELGSALDTIEGKGKADVIRAHARLTDLSANVTLVVGQFNIKNLAKFIKKKTKLE